VTNLEILKNYLTQVWEEQNLSAIDIYFDKQSTTTGMTSDFEAQIQDFHSLVPAFLQYQRNLKIEILQAMEQDNQAWVLLVVKSRRASDLKPIATVGQIRIETRNGKIIKMDNHIDLIGFFEQLGFLPDNTMALCLSGHTLS
jgi:hypothetical protein